MNARPGRRFVVERNRRLDRAAARDDERTAAVDEPVARAVLGRDEQRLAADVQRRVEPTRLHARVERLEPPAGREPEREVVVEQVDRRRVLDRHERRRLLDDRRPRGARAGTGRRDAPRPSTATGCRRAPRGARSVMPACIGESVRSSFQTSSARRAAEVDAEPPRELVDDLDVVARLAGRVERLAHALHAALARGDGPLGLRPAGTARQHDVGELGGLRQEEVLHDEMVEPPRAVSRALAGRPPTAPGSRRST